MAKIAKFDKYSSVLNKTFTADVYYHLDKNRLSSTGFFYIVIPDESNALYEQYANSWRWHNRGTSKIIVGGKSAEEAMKFFVEYMEIFTTAKSTTEKVIMYCFRFSSKNKLSASKKDRFMSDDNTYEAKIKFDFAVCEKTDFQGKITYKPLDENKKLNIGRDSMSKPKDTTGSYGEWIEIPYTEEAEAFFSRIYFAMENIMEQLMNHIGTKKGAQIMIRNKQNLLA